MYGPCAAYNGREPGTGGVELEGIDDRTNRAVTIYAQGLKKATPDVAFISNGIQVSPEVDKIAGITRGRVELEGIDDRANRAMSINTYRLEKAMNIGTAVSNGIDVPGNGDDERTGAVGRVKVKGIDDSADKAMSINTYRLERAVRIGAAISNGIHVACDVDDVRSDTAVGVKLEGVDEEGWYDGFEGVMMPKYRAD
ncbi:hypothetical protein ES708_27805 [subsurface metagenome]